MNMLRKNAGGIGLFVRKWRGEQGGLCLLLLIAYMLVGATFKDRL